MAGLVLQKSDQGRSVACHVGDKVVIRLEENPTTGYRWALLGGHEPVLGVLQSEFSAVSGGAIGAGGSRTRVLAARAQGAADVRLSLRQEWEGERSASDPFSVYVQVT